MGSKMHSLKFGVMRSSGGDAQSSSEVRNRKSHGFRFAGGWAVWNECAWVGGWVGGQKKNKACIHLRRYL